jgi:hypothetical protein
MGPGCQRAKARGEGRAADSAAAGPAQEEDVRAGLQEEQEKGRAAGMGQRRGRPKAKRREGDQGFFKPFYFFHFQKILNSFLTSVKTTHHKNKYAAA